jgi:hypothetical protein
MTERDRDLTWHLYLCESRMHYIRQYRTAIYRSVKRDARAWVLHYGRLLRSCSKRVIFQ